MKKFKFKSINKIKIRIDIEDAIDIVEDVCEEHVPGLYTLKKSNGELMAISKNSAVVYCWDCEGIDKNLLHCLAHSFCADVLMSQKD